MRVGLSVAVIVVAVAAWAWSALMPETHVWRQKLTLIVETPEGERVGSSVTEVRARFHGQSIGNEVDYDLTGEAVVVEVLPGRYLFALLGGSEELFYWAAKGRFLGKSRGEWLREIPNQAEAVPVRADQTPMLVTFGDITKPETVREVVEQYDLSPEFGEGVRLKSVTLEITQEPVTVGRVKGVLGWLDDVWPNQLDGQRFKSLEAKNRFANSLSANSFSTEITGK